MKKYYLFLLSLITAICITSCEEGVDDIFETDIVGTWYSSWGSADDGTNIIAYTFNTDATFAVDLKVYDSEGALVDEECDSQTGVYAFDSEASTLYMAIGDADITYVATISDGVLTIVATGDDGYTLIFTKNPISAEGSTDPEEDEDEENEDDSIPSTPSTDATGATGFVKELVFTYDDNSDESEVFSFGYDDDGRMTSITLVSTWYSLGDLAIASIADTRASVSESDIRDVLKGKIPTTLLQRRGGRSTVATRSTSGTIEQETATLLIEYGTNTITMTILENGVVEDSATATLNSDGSMAELRYEYVNENYEYFEDELVNIYTYVGSGTVNYSYSGGYLSSMVEYSEYSEVDSDGAILWANSSSFKSDFAWSAGNLTTVKSYYKYDDDGEFNLYGDMANSYGADLNNLSVDLGAYLLEYNEWLSGLERGLLGESSTNLVTESLYGDYWSPTDAEPSYYYLSKFDYGYTDGVLTSVEVYSAGSESIPSSSDLSFDIQVEICYY